MFPTAMLVMTYSGEFLHPAKAVVTEFSQVTKLSTSLSETVQQLHSAQLHHQLPSAAPLAPAGAISMACSSQLDGVLSLAHP